MKNTMENPGENPSRLSDLRTSPFFSLVARPVSTPPVTSLCLQTNGTTFVAFHWFIHGKNNGINNIFNYFILVYSVTIRSILIQNITRKLGIWRNKLYLFRLISNYFCALWWSDTHLANSDAVRALTVTGRRRQWWKFKIKNLWNFCIYLA